MECSSCYCVIPEVEKIISHLERGTPVTKFSFKRRSERKTLAIRRETRQIIWTHSIITTRHVYEGAVDWAEIKEIRLGKISKDFETWCEDARDFENSQCFVVFYGSEFNLRFLSIAAASEVECDLWIRGLRHLIKNRKNVPYPLQIQAWLRKTFYELKSEGEMLNLKHIKFFLSKINYKISNNELREIFNQVDTKKKGEIGFDEFTTLYQKIVMDENNPAELFDKILLYLSNLKTMSLQDVASFFVSEQNDEIGNDDRAVSQFIWDFLMDPHREIEEPYFTISEFIDFLFSKQNDVWDPTKDKVYQDMSRPLSHYWISSSHNTYLTGNQVNSMSSIECYARCLRMGCRCIELDCWDGPDGTPIVYHGYTLTTRIKFVDVIKTIKENAFVTSGYPVILSIEQCCSVPQQKKMAAMMQEIFGEMLMVPPVEGETKLPSPYNLRHKIILKHKKLPEGQEESVQEVSDINIGSSIKNGVMYLKDPVTFEWKLHYFVLTQNKLFYTGNYKPDCDKSDDEEDDGSFQQPMSNVRNEEMHFSEPWFHGSQIKGPKEAEELWQKYAYLGDGTFLVRASARGAGNYTLSFWYGGHVKHCRIHSKQEEKKTVYFFIEGKYFDCLYNLITYYRTVPLITPDFSVTLQKPLPQPNLHETKEWFHKNIDKSQAEKILKTVEHEGSFLVRPSENEPNCYTISFRADRTIKHCRIKLEGRLYTVSNMEFESLVDLIHFYEEHPLYGKVELKHAISEEMVTKMNTEHFSSPTHSTIPPVDSSPKVDEISGESMFQGSLDLKGAMVDMRQNLQNSEMEWIIRIVTSMSLNAFECAVESKDLAQEWYMNIQQVINRTSELENEHRELERTKKIAKEMSNLIIYCRSVNFNLDMAKQQSFVFYEMSSFPEHKAEKLICQQEREFFLKYHQVQLSRVYPKGHRLSSSNYNPINMWNCGSQVVALNFQTGDKAMQLNQAKFRDNGMCGYLLKPDFMFREGFDPFNRIDLLDVEPFTITIRIIAGRYLCRCRKGIASPFVEVEVIGAPFDSGVKFTTRRILDNGFNPKWNEACVFEIANPHFALLRFLVQDEDMFGEPKFIGQATYPVTCLRTGYRSVWLKNSYSEDLELASLLIHISIRKKSV